MEQWNRNYYYLYNMENGERKFLNVLTANSMDEGRAAALRYIPNDRYWRGVYVIVEMINGEMGGEMTFAAHMS